MSDKTELKPCPFCGNSELDAENHHGHGGDYIMCVGEKGCGAMISRCDTPDDDLNGAWNRRATIQPTAAPSDEAVANAVRAFINAGKRGCDMFGAISAALTEAARCAVVAPADAVRDARDLAQTVDQIVAAAVAQPELVRGALLYKLWGHQGGSSTVGQPIRTLLNIHGYMTKGQVDEAEAYKAHVNSTPKEPAK